MGKNAFWASILLTDKAINVLEVIVYQQRSADTNWLIKIFEE